MTKTSASHIDSAAIGVEVSWSFGHGDAQAVTLTRDSVREALSRHGFDPTRVADVSEDMALRKAQYSVKGRSREIVIQELRRPRKDTPRAFGVYRVTGQTGEAGDDVTMQARVRCGSREVVCLPPEGQSVFTDPGCEKIGNDIARLANSLLNNVINRDISDMLVAIGWDRLGWISRRRNSGGVYFVPTCEETERFVALLQDLETMSQDRVAHKPVQLQRAYHFIPQVMEVYPKPLTMSMWKGSAQDQYAAQTEALLKDLKKMQGDEGEKMRDSTIAARAAECDRLIAQADTHRLFLEGAADSIRGELTTLRAGFTKRLDEHQAEANAAFDAIEVATPRRKKRVSKPRVDVAPTEPDLATMSADDLFGV